VVFKLDYVIFTLPHTAFVTKEEAPIRVHNKNIIMLLFLCYNGREIMISLREIQIQIEFGTNCDKTRVTKTYS
jgi:hypothetical protein